VGVDRESAVRKAEELVREGKTELAIDEYLRLVEDQPGDFGAANALGDLYARIGNRAAAATQFVKIGDSHRDSGFIPKAVAFYKKALKADPASEHALSQLAQIAVEQELYADATLYLNRLLQRRRDQNNEAGVAECLVRLDRSAEAVPIIDECIRRAAGNDVHPRVIPDVMWLRLQLFETMRDAVGCLETAGKWEALKRNDAQSLYQSSCFRAVCAAVIQETDRTPAGAAKAKEQADQATAWLKQAVAAGYKSAEHMEEDTNQPQNEELLHFRTEAEELLKVGDERPTTKPELK